VKSIVASCGVASSIEGVNDKLERIRKGELDRYSKHLSIHEAEMLEDVTKKMILRIVALSTSKVKQCAESGNQQKMVALLHQLFDNNEIHSFS